MCPCIFHVCSARSQTRQGSRKPKSPPWQLQASADPRYQGPHPSCCAYQAEHAGNHRALGAQLLKTQANSPRLHSACPAMHNSSKTWLQTLAHTREPRTIGCLQRGRQQQPHVGSAEGGQKQRAQTEPPETKAGHTAAQALNACGCVLPMGKQGNNMQPQPGSIVLLSRGDAMQATPVMVIPSACHCAAFVHTTTGRLTGRPLLAVLGDPKSAIHDGTLATRCCC